jgi:membrane protease YdiL (CAAX protease family)
MGLTLERGFAPDIDHQAELEAEVQDWLRTVTGDPTAQLDAKPARALEDHEIVRDVRAGSRATKTVVKVIVANLIVQATMYAIGRVNGWDSFTAMRTGIFVAAAFYAITAGIVTIRSENLGIRAHWLLGPARTALAIGGAIGGALAIALTGVLTLATGTPTVDPSARALAAGESIGVLIAGALIIAVVAPLVEELVFRGFLTEALRSRGRNSAVVLSGLAFAAAHLRFAQLRYYLLMGAGLGALYWKRGLLASIAAHAAFNGLLVVFAIASVHGPARFLEAGGVSVRLPSMWQEAKGPAQLDLAAVGPAGAQLGISHADLPPGVTMAADRLADGIRGGALARVLPGDVVLNQSSVQTVTVANRTAVRADATVKGHPETVIFVPGNSRIVVLEVVTNGSARAQRDFDEMLTTAKF